MLKVKRASGNFNTGEITTDYVCGCCINAFTNSTPLMLMCPLHNAAPALLEALQAIAHQLIVGESSEGDPRDISWCAETARAAIAQVKGK